LRLRHTHSPTHRHTRAVYTVRQIAEYVGVWMASISADKVLHIVLASSAGIASRHDRNRRQCSRALFCTAASSFRPRVAARQRRTFDRGWISRLRCRSG